MSFLVSDVRMKITLRLRTLRPAIFAAVCAKHVMKRRDDVLLALFAPIRDRRRALVIPAMRSRRICGGASGRGGRCCGLVLFANET
jgi:hypothetical protein